MTTPAPGSRAAPTGPFGGGTDLGAAFDLATQVKPLVVAVGAHVVPLVDPAHGGLLLGQFAPARERIALALGFVMPSVSLRDDQELRPDAYAIRVRGVTVAHGTARPGRWLAVVGQGSDWAAVSPGEPTSDPATGRAAYWIGEDDVARARAVGHTVLDPTGAMVAHLEAAVRANAWRLIDRDHVLAQLDAMAKRDPRLAAAIARRFDLGLLTRVLRRLLAEGVSIRDFAAVLEALDETPPMIKASLPLAEQVRRRLAPAICRGVAPEGVLHVVDLRAWERLALRGADAALRPGPAYPLGPLAARALASLRDRVLAAGTPGQVAVVRAPVRLRPHLGVLLAAGPGPVTVLAADEVPPDFTVLAAAPPQLPPGVAARNMVRRWRVRGQLGRERVAVAFGWVIALGRLVRELPAALVRDFVELPQLLATERLERHEREEAERDAARRAELGREAQAVRDQYGPEFEVVVLRPADLAAADVASHPVAWLEWQQPEVAQALLAPLSDVDVSWLLDALRLNRRDMILALFPRPRRELLERIWEDRRGDFSSVALDGAIAALLVRLGLDAAPAAGVDRAPAAVPGAETKPETPPAWPPTGAHPDELAPAIAGRDRPLAPESPPEPGPEPEPEPELAPDLSALETMPYLLMADLLMHETRPVAAAVLARLTPGYADLVLMEIARPAQDELIDLMLRAPRLTADMAPRIDFLHQVQVDRAVGQGAFGFLEQLDPEMVADMLTQERPGIAAGVIATLNPGFADMVLSVMPPDLQEDLITRLQTGRELSRFQASQIARDLRRRLGLPA